MEKDLSPFYPLIGEFCLKCGAVEFELDRFLFGASDLYRERLGAKLKGWPQQATGKQDAFEFVFASLMQNPPVTKDLGFMDFAEVNSAFERISKIRNLIIHGTPVAVGNGPNGLDFSKVTRPSNGESGYRFVVENVSSSELKELLNEADKLVLFLDACILALRRERDGWLAIDLTAGRQIFKYNLVARARRSTDPSIAYGNGNEQK